MTIQSFSEEMRKQGLLQWLNSLQFDNTTSPDLQLTMGAVIVEEMRAEIERQTGFQCSAGISHNKVKAHHRFHTSRIDMSRYLNYSHIL